MKAKYKVGDWVYFLNPATDKKEVAKVVETYDDGKVTVEQASGKRLLALESDIEGIPLTEEILMKNGWKWDERNCDWRLGGLAIAPYELNGKEHMAAYAYSNQDLVNIYDIDYVHELQHFMWALEMEDELEI